MCRFAACPGCGGRVSVPPPGARPWREVSLSTVLVTGGAGYIGSHTARALLAAGYDVVLYDDLSAGHPEVVGRLVSAANGRRVALVEGDVRDTRRVETAIRAHGAQAVLHFAALLNVADSVSHPLAYYSVNVTGALSVLEAMAHAGVSRLVFSSTCATFGIPARLPMAEDDPQHPINAYGEAKLAVERALPHVERAHGIRFVALRYFNAAGADPDGLLGEDHDPEIHLIPRAIAAAAGGEPLQVFGTDYPTPDGTCLRDYIHVADLADAHVRALAWLEQGGASAAFNLGNGTPHSVRQVIETVGKVAGRPVPHTTAPRRPGDPAALYASNARIRASLGWTPRFADLETIITTAWHWHRSHPHGYRQAVGR